MSDCPQPPRSLEDMTPPARAIQATRLTLAHHTHQGLCDMITGMLWQATCE